MCKYDECLGSEYWPLCYTGVEVATQRTIALGSVWIRMHGYMSRCARAWDDCGMLLRTRNHGRERGMGWWASMWPGWRLILRQDVMQSFRPRAHRHCYKRSVAACLGLVPQRSVSLLRRDDILARVMRFARADTGACKPCHGGAGGCQGGGGPTRRPHEEEASAAPRRLGR